MGAWVKFFARKWPEIFLKGGIFPKMNTYPKNGLHFLLRSLDTAFT